MKKCPRTTCQSTDIEHIGTQKVGNIKLETYWCNGCNHSFHKKTTGKTIKIIKQD